MTPEPEPRHEEPDFGPPSDRGSRPEEWSRHPIDGAGPDDDEGIEAEFYGHAADFGIDLG